MCKRIISLALSLATLFALSTTSLAASETNNAQHTTNNIIIAQALEVDKKLDASDGNFGVVSLTSGTINALAEGESNQAIQSVTEENGLITVTTIFPYKCLSNGELVSSFDYTPPQSRDTSTVTSEFVDTTVTVTAYYAHYTSLVNVSNFYRHAGVEAYWSSNNSTASASRLEVSYQACGDLYEYPECMDVADESTTLVQSDYSIQCLIDQTNPIKNTTYLNGSTIMPLDRVLQLNNGAYHSFSIDLRLSYTVNGTSYTHSRFYNILQ